MKTFALLLLLSGTAHAGGFFRPARLCEHFYHPPNLTALRSALAQAQQKWAASHIKNYSYTMNYGYSMEASGNKEVNVRGGKVAAGQDGQTMEQLFADLESRLKEAAGPKSCLMVEAKYSASDGHILSVSWQNTEQGLMDAFGGYTVTRFRAGGK